MSLKRSLIMPVYWIDYSGDPSLGHLVIQVPQLLDMSPIKF